MSKRAVDTAVEIEKIVRTLLKQSKAWGKFPTPVDQIVKFANLTVENGVDLSKVEPRFLEKFEFVPKFAKKVLGILDYRQKVIYLDHSVKSEKKCFVKLHEVIHEVLPWQRDLLGFMDDETTLDPDVREQFEAEANYGASSLFFQLDLFDEQAQKLPLSIKSPLVLAKNFGASGHASIRRYVERCSKRCALLVLHPPETENGHFKVRRRDYFQSESFTKSFGEIIWPDVLGWNLSFISEIKFKRRLHEEGSLELPTSGDGQVKFAYHFFNNGYNTFIFIVPPGEKIFSRVVILEKR